MNGNGNVASVKIGTGVSSRRAAIVVVAVLLAGPVFAAGDLPTKFTNTGSIANTRHNLTQRPPAAGGPAGATMDSYRNDYGEVCIYCHTPHGANTTINAPLWNRTNKGNTYTVYNLIGSQASGNTVSQPGANSLTCLSCHDGTVAVDSIINMPGSGRYSAAQQTAQDNSFLNTWSNPSGLNAALHLGLDQAGCLSCHIPGSVPGATATDFTLFALGTDLNNDHPVGIAYPTAAGADFNTPTATRGNLKFFDTNGNSRPDKNEVRVYNTGEGYEVECASCHDPHGVGPGAGGSGGPFNKTFLRVSNSGSGVCLTCHVK